MKINQEELTDYLNCQYWWVKGTLVMLPVGKYTGIIFLQNIKLGKFFYWKVLAYFYLLRPMHSKSKN